MSNHDNNNNAIKIFKAGHHRFVNGNSWWSMVMKKGKNLSKYVIIIIALDAKDNTLRTNFDFQMISFELLSLESGASPAFSVGVTNLF